ncbi:hypothetical protein BT93_L5780 [Corymbia citriodora subsp. variegata]|uniref:SURF1-like protein n=1 Tax=Corymbia citriodora subsp. variegata TaxID=360336 RepID=A0A8T0CFW7_CORYI|nr:hypothetical protein BT93_L5780 [Corymbia citriodora subsp. variegata]
MPNRTLLDAIFSVTRRTTLKPHLSTNLRSQPRRTVLTRPVPKPGVSSDASDPGFTSIVDQPPQLITTRRKHKKSGIILLAAIPITAFILGTWQIYRLDRKSKLIAKFEDRLVRPPLPLPPRIDPEAIHEFDYRRVYAKGILRHDKEMLVGPRLHDGKDGYLVITPLEREDGSTILINRGWVSREQRFHQDRDSTSLPSQPVTISGLLREPWQKNMFTPDNDLANGKFYFPDVKEMAQYAGAEPVWIEETMAPSLLESYRREELGVPIARAPEVNLRNNHVQYIVTCFDDVDGT